MKNIHAGLLILPAVLLSLASGCSTQADKQDASTPQSQISVPVDALPDEMTSVLTDDASTTQATRISPESSPAISTQTPFGEFVGSYNAEIAALTPGLYAIGQTNSDIFILSLDTGNSQAIRNFTDSPLAISPDQKTLALWSQDPNGGLILLDLTTGSDTILPVNSECWGNLPQWSPDSASIAVKCWGDARMRIELYNVATLEREGVLNIPESFFSARMLQDISISSFAWSPDGEWMGYIATNPSFESLNSSVLITAVSCIRTGAPCDDGTQLIETSQIESQISWISSDQILVTPFTPDGSLEIYSIQDHALVNRVSFELAAFINSIVALPQNGGILISVESTRTSKSGIYLFLPDTGEIKDIEQSDSEQLLLGAFSIK